MYNLVAIQVRYDYGVIIDFSIRVRKQRTHIKNFEGVIVFDEFGYKKRRKKSK